MKSISERSIFTAYDINREIEERLQFGNCPEWHFPITSMNRIYTSAIDIFCQFIEDYDIKSKEEKAITFVIPMDKFKYYSTNIDDFYLESGYYEIRIGSSSRDIRLKDKILL